MEWAKAGGYTYKRIIEQLRKKKLEASATPQRKRKRVTFSTDFSPTTWTYNRGLPVYIQCDNQTMIDWVNGTTLMTARCHMHIVFGIQGVLFHMCHQRIIAPHLNGSDWLTHVVRGLNTRAGILVHDTFADRRGLNITYMYDVFGRLFRKEPIALAASFDGGATPTTAAVACEVRL